MSEGFANEAVGGITLVRPAIRSPNFVTGVSGWTINVDGSAEFDNLTIRGTFLGTDFIVSSAGLFVYSGTPAAGNLIASVAAAAGTDGFANAYRAGITSYQPGAGLVELLAGIIRFGGTGITTDGQIEDPGGNLSLNSSLQSGGDVSALLELQSTSGTTDHTAPEIVAFARLQLQLPGGSSGYAVPVDPNNAFADEIFHTMTPFLNGWTNGGRAANRYRLLPIQNEAELVGSLTVPAGVAAGQNIVNLPAAYRPSSNQSIPARNLTGNVTVWLAYGPAGNLQFAGPVAGVANGDILDFHRLIPLTP